MIAASQKTTCAEPSFAATPTHGSPTMKRICVSARSVSPSSRLSSTGGSLTGGIVCLRLRHNHRGAVAENLGDALHHFRRVVADADDGVRPELLRVLEQQV